MDGSTIDPQELTRALTVSRLEAKDEGAWDQFVAAHPDGSPFHLLAWRDAVNEALGYDTPYLIAMAGETVAGVLPLVHLKTRLFGNSLVSTGFSVGGGILAMNDAVADVLAKAAIALADERKVPCLELRGETAAFADWPTKSGTYAGFTMPLEPDSDKRLAAIPRKKRADVRKGIKAALPVNTNATVDTFYELYARNLHALGTPILPKRWYAALKKHFGDQCEIATVAWTEGPVVALMSFYFRDTVYPYYVGALPEARGLRAFDHVYWNLMERSVERGVTVFDFGRSKPDTGSYDYKKYWGFEPKPLEYQYHLANGAEMPDVNPNNPKYARFVKTWKKLPFAVTKQVGPYLARQLG